MNKLYFEKLSAFDRLKEPCTIAIPFERATTTSLDMIAVADDNGQVLSQAVPTAFWDDGSVKWGLIDFLADLPANKEKVYYCNIVKEKNSSEDINIFTENNKTVVKTDKLCLKLNNNGVVFNLIKSDFIAFDEKHIKGPILNGKYGAVVEGGWKVVKNGPVTAVLEAKGKHYGKENSSLLDFIITIQVYKEKDWFKIDYKILNMEDCESVVIKSLNIDLVRKTTDKIRIALATSNYKTNLRTGTGADTLFYNIDANHLVYEANEHFPEVFYGTFFADWTDERGGVCASVYQAYQNYPKALKVDKNGISIQIVPKESKINFIKGMAKTHTLFLHIHDAQTTLDNINIRALQLQMPDRPYLDMEVYRDAKVFPDLFLNKWEKIEEVEKAFMHRADVRSRAFGILHWGDTPDMHYTKQGRGNGHLVWVNNEYDFTHTAMLMYARSGERRLLDYLLVSARHWMDIDVCHYSDDEFRQGAQIIHSANHVTGEVEISHEWVDGLFDYYHMTGDRFAYDTAIGIGNNIKKNLTKPRYHKEGQISARETGWALRALVTLYMETNDKSWLEDADFIVGHFENWKEKYGLWMAPYTDHTAIRVPFMIAIAVSSLMRYYVIKPHIEIKNMIIEAVDDMVENCILDSGLFYYKELPSLKRIGTNTTVLEALAYAYKLTQNRKYLDAGLKTFKSYMGDLSGGYSGDKNEIEDAVVVSGTSSKGLAQSFIPVAEFYVTAVRAGLKIEC